MNRKPLTIGIFAALAAAVLPVAAQAQYHGGGPGYDRPAPAYGDDGDRDRRGYREGDDRSDYGRGYDQRGYYGRRERCRSDGTAGALIGAIAGGLLGNSVAGHGDRAAGTIVGGVGGALAGRAIDRDC